MVMFKAKFRPMSDKPRAMDSDNRRKPAAQQQQQQPPQPKVPPIEEERGPQYPVREPEPTEAPERAKR